MGCCESRDGNGFEGHISNSKTKLKRSESQKFIIIVGDLYNYQELHSRFMRQIKDLKKVLGRHIGDDNVEIRRNPERESLAKYLQGYLNQSSEEIERIEICFIGDGGHEGLELIQDDDPFGDNSYLALSPEQNLERKFFADLLAPGQKEGEKPKDEENRKPTREVILYSFCHRVKRWASQPLATGVNSSGDPWTINLAYVSTGFESNFWPRLRFACENDDFFRRISHTFHDDALSPDKDDFRLLVVKQTLIHCFIPQGDGEKCCAISIFRKTGLPDLTVWIKRLEQHPEACPDNLSLQGKDISHLKYIFGEFFENHNVFEDLENDDYSALIEFLFQSPRLDHYAHKVLENKEARRADFRGIVGDYRNWRSGEASSTLL
mmetsp:Transcript_13242/g.14624  ORF Transcript_13242/g.14624 Transcript_13242/m.14624 type:complete len:378 (+) Transcript_13242:344-1477(+)